MACAIFALSFVLVSSQTTGDEGPIRPESMKTSDTDEDTELVETWLESAPIPEAVEPKAPPRQLSDTEKTLTDLNDNLSALLKGTPPPSSDIEALFNVSLDAPDQLTRRIDVLKNETAKLEARRLQLNELYQNTEQRILPPERPALLDSPPVPPVAPTAPVPPTKPEKPRRAKGPELKAFKAAMAVYNEFFVTYEADEAAYQLAIVAYETNLTAFQEADAAYRQAERDFEAAIAARQDAIAKSKEEIAAQQREIALRIGVSHKRSRYLSALASLYQQMPGPAATVFTSLKGRRGALRDRAKALNALAAEVALLNRRVTLLRDRVTAGSLVGFTVHQKDLVEGLTGDIAAIEKRVETLRQLSNRLTEIADSIETDGKAMRDALLTAAAAPDREARLDALFLEKVKESRSAPSARTGFTVSDAEIQTSAETIHNTLTAPDHIMAISDGESQRLALRSSLDQLDRILDTIPLGLDRHRQAFGRELVTLTAALASETAKQRAFALSETIIEDIWADLNMLKVELSLFIENRITGIVSIPAAVQTQAGLIRLLRIGLGIVLILGLIALRSRIRQAAARTILRLINLKLFRKRAGLLVRMTVFLLALLPLFLVTGAGYLLLALIGFEYTEIKTAEIFFRYGMFYFLGRQVVLGLTQKQRRGRPPLIDLGADDAKLLQQTYARLGLFLMLAAAAGEWSREWLGTGSLGLVVRLAAYSWIGVWTLWALFAWRRPLASRAVRQITPGTKTESIARFVEAHIVGVLLTPLVLVGLILSGVYRSGEKLLKQGGLSGYVRARILRRMSRKNQSTAPTAPVSQTLPERYVRQFPLYPLQGEEGEVLLPRETELAAVTAQIAHWKSTGQDGSLVIVGEKGIGKTTFLALLEKQLGSQQVTRHTLAGKMRSPTALLSDLGGALGLESPKSVGALARHLNEGPEQVVLLDEAHNIFLRTVDGFKPAQTLSSLVDFTSDKVFWVMVFNRFSWAFLSKTGHHVSAFRKQLYLPRWSRTELQKLVAARNERSGVTVMFDEILLDAESSSTGGFELISSAEGFFRLLFEASRGNPRVATYLWLGALSPVDDNRIRVGLIREASVDPILRMADDMLFALAAVAQHENLSVNELHLALGVPLDEAVQTGRYLLEYGFVEPKHSDPRRLTLAPRFHQQVLKVLQMKNLLFQEE